MEQLQGPNNEMSEGTLLIFVWGQSKAEKAVFVQDGFFKSA